MAKLNHTISFKNAEISLEDNQIVEFLKDETLSHTLSDIINRFAGKKVDITFKEVSELEPESHEG
ncbi:YonK family protein [Bacillus smithii]|uniref:YonK family protein n=1 Tax=Bacillus smithii TaxID=1479 RepID=UPI002E244992|nr:YonK family protein [Bacillus smithii]MED4928957.1 YonK family protein [Bacillus smithii]